MEPQGRMSDRSSSPQGKESPQRQKGKTNSAEVMKPRDLPRAKKQKPMDSDDAEEVPQKQIWNVFKHSASTITFPVRISIQIKRSIDQYYFDQFTKNIDQYGL